MIKIKHTTKSLIKYEVNYNVDNSSGEWKNGKL